jgi:hypothetical protein
MSQAWFKRCGLACLLLVSVACSHQASAAAEVELGEFWVAPDHRVLEAGTVELAVENYGEFPHTLVVSDASGTVIAATDLIAPETETLLRLTVEPGTYMFTCRIVNGLEDGTVVDHYQNGMSVSVEVVS